MRMKYLPLLATGLLLFGLVAFTLPARAQDGPNLLENPGFEGGHFNQDGIAEIAVPNGWRMHWSNGELIFGGEWPTARPETVVWNSTGGVPEGEEIFWRDGIYTMKVFKSWAPMWAAMSQDVENLEVGRKYRLVVPIFVDIFEEFEGGKKIIPVRKDTGRVRLGASAPGAGWRDENAIAYSGWWTAETIDPFYQAMPTFIYDFVATQPTMTVWIEMASTYPYPNNGFFYDLPGLYALDEVQPVAQPAPVVQQGAAPGAVAAAAPAAPLPASTLPEPREDGSIVHTVASGDTLWVIAIRYANALGLTAEEALPRIQELNNSPTFLNPGDELLIVPAGAAPAQEGAAEAEAAVVEDGASAERIAEEVTTDEAVVDAPPAELESDPAMAETQAAAETGPLAGTICVAAFNDANGDGQRDSSEGLVPNAAIAISRPAGVVSTYITDGASEPYCIELADADSYTLQMYAPAGFAPTTTDNWAVPIANNESYTVSFGLREGPVAVADAGPAAADSAAASQTADSTAALEEESGNSLTNNLGIIALGVAGVLVLLAVVGVVLLRRG